MRSVLIAIALALSACSAGSDVSREVGARCDVNGDCDDRCLAPSNEFPDGFCTLDCSDSRDCPSDADCVDLEGGVCLFSCEGDPDCEFLGPDWICREENLREDNTRVSVCRGT